MNSEDEEWVRQAFTEAEKRRCIAKILSVDRKDVVAKGDNYTSDLSRLTMRVVLNSGEVENRTVIYKCLPGTDRRKKHIAESGLFVIEKRMYTEVLPLMEKIRREKESGDPLWGECYASQNYDAMLLEDLAVYGCKMGDRMKGLDYDHCVIALKSLAKFHALGAVLKQRGDLILYDYQKHFVEKNLDMMRDFYKASFQGLANTAEQQWKGEWVTYAEKLRKKSETIVEEMLAKFQFDKSRFATLNHGDFWVNNMLFKYGEDGKPQTIRFIDFQISFINTVGIDLEYFLSTSTLVDLVPRREELIEVYHESLVAFLEKFGYTGEVPSLENVKDDCDQSSIFGLAMAVMVLPFIKMPSNEVPDIEAHLEAYETSGGHEVPPDTIQNSSKEYENAMKTALKKAVERGIL